MLWHLYALVRARVSALLVPLSSLCTSLQLHYGANLASATSTLHAMSHPLRGHACVRMKHLLKRYT